MNIIDKAYDFAKRKHDATGKLYNGQPYIVHPLAVFRILEHIPFKEFDENLLAAAYLHDVVEDTDTNLMDLASEFNGDIADLVQEVTKDENKNFLYLHTECGLMLKCADRMANIASLSEVQDEVRRAKLFKKYSHCFINEGLHLEIADHKNSL